MNILLYNEWIKFRKTKLMIWSFFIILIPFVIGFGLILLMDVSHNMDSTKFMNAILWLNVRFYGLCIFTYVASEHVAVEFKTEVLRDQWTIPISRTSFFFSKIIFLSLWSLIVSVLSYLMALLFVLSIVKEPHTLKWMFESLVYFIMASVLTWPFMYFSVMLVIKFKKVWLTMSINILIFIASIILTTFSWSATIPWLSPLWIIFFMSNKDTTGSYISLMAFTALVLYVGHKYIYKIEV